MKIYKRILSLILVIAMVAGYLPTNVMHTHAEESDNTLAGKTISILGASISTYAGTSNGAAADTTNSTIRDNAKYYPQTAIPEVTLNDTWWMQVANDLDLRLLVNNAWSGSSLLHTRSGTVGAYVDRCVQLHDDTGENAGEEPDIIGIQMGTNDFQYYKDTLGTSDIDYDSLIVENEDGTYSYKEPTTSLEAAAIVLHKISVRYPNAEVYYLSLSQRIDGYTELLEQFNEDLKSVCEHFGTTYVDIYNCGINQNNFGTYIGDNRVHPNNLGMDAYAEAFKKAVVENTAYEVSTHKVSLELTDVTADYGVDKLVVDEESFEMKLTIDSGNDMEVTVTMGEKDVTEDVYADGTVSIEAVTDDVVITAKGVHVPQTYRWELSDTGLESVKNPLTQLSGTVTDGQFSEISYELTDAVVLKHNLPWSVEWKCEGTFQNASGSSGARIFTSTNVNAEYGARYVFKSNKNGLIAMGEKDSAGSHNYGIALGNYGIDWTELHTYRLENRISDDGSNMIYLFVDDVEISPMNHYYVGTTDKNITSDWLSGKDFVFPYMGTDTHGFTNCSVEYIAVYEDGYEQLNMRYDDHMDIADKEVEIVDAGTPTSYQVGYDVEEQTPDKAVVIVEEENLVATGIGTALVRIDGQLCEITVEAAPISLLLLIGQSNMRGSEGDANQSIVCPDGMVYSTYGDDRGASNTAMTVANATQFAPSALTGHYSTINVEGTTVCLSGYPINTLTEAGIGKIGPDSGFAYEWVKQTGEKVWVVNAAHGGSSITTWSKTGVNYKEAIALFGACQETLQKEIEAGHYTLSHMGYFWCQGCSDNAQTAEWYVNRYLAIHQNLKTDLSFDDDSNAETPDKVFEFGGIIPVRAGHEYYISYREGISEYKTSAKYHESFKDLRMTGPRVAQYWMCNNPELEDIWLVCRIGEDWVTMPDGTNGVAEYFEARYENGIVDYTTQVTQSASWYKPTTPAAVHDSIHYNQIGYNEIGRESVRNALINLGEIEEPEVETTVEFVSWDGFSRSDEVTATPVGNSGTLVIPIVSPVYKSKEVTYKLSEGLTYDYYDILADSVSVTGTLTSNEVNSDTISVVTRELTSYRWSFDGTNLIENTEYGDSANVLVKLGGSLSNEIFSSMRYRTTQPIALMHDEAWVVEWIMDGVNDTTSNYMFLSTESVSTTGQPYVYIHPKNGFIGIGAHNGSNHICNGRKLTESGIDMLDGTHTYRMVNRVNDDGTNMVYLFVDGKEVGPLNKQYKGSTTYLGESDWINGKDFCFPYIGTSNYPMCGFVIDYMVVSEKGTDENIHFHNYSDWATVSVPSADVLGVESRICESCGDTQTREVEGLWQLYDFSTHLQDLPENFCGGMNLWAVLDHDSEYFASGVNWGTHGSGNVYSVTFPINEGDKIYASSFGKGGTHGANTNGIRMTYFDEYGVIKTLTPAETYAEFSKNGYLTAPDGAKYINVPMWTNSDEWEIYNLSLEHNYSGVACTSCGAQHPNLANYEGKIISILSASTSTYAGYIPVADGFNLEHRARYPQDNLLTDVNETWWMQVISKLNAKLGINDSWAGSQVLNTIDGNSGDLGEDAAMASITRIKNLGANGTPDVILFFGGGNDMGRGVTLGSFDPSTAPAEVDLTATKWDSFADAYVAAIMRLQFFYPDTEIVAMTSYEMQSYVTAAKLNKYGPVIKAICEHYGVKYLDLRDCGTTFDMLPDNIHPNAEGMDYITADVLQTLLNDVQVEAGENVVYPITHKLSNAEASLHYYKGISKGDSFVEAITGEDLIVSVTMGDEDITSLVYNQGLISIPEVTDAVVITAKGTFNADGHLQKLPENACRNTNLWKELEPENTYYLGTKWGLYTSSPDVHSVTIPVQAGDKIWATSFGSTEVNGLSAAGTRITWFDEDGVLESLTRDKVYSEFAEYGYITVPEGAVALNVPMASGSEEWELYNLSLGHKYSEMITTPTCTEEGYTTYTCTRCANTYVGDKVEAVGHSYGEWYSTKEATFTEDGEEARECEKCSHYETREVALYVVTSGNLGYGTEPTDKVIYTLYSNGTMVLTGEGKLFGNSWRGDNQPFIEYRKQIKYLLIGEGITSTNSGGLAQLTSLEGVEFPSTFTALPNNAFMNSFAESVTEITVPKTIEYLGAYSLGHYGGDASAYFTDVIIENPNINIADHQAVFNGGAKLDKLTLYSYGKENNVSNYAKKYGINYIDLNNYISGEYDGINYVLYDGVLTLSTDSEDALLPSEGAFWNEYSDLVTKIIIENGIAEISAEAFKDYSNLSEITLNDGIKSIGEEAFSTTEKCNRELNITIPKRIEFCGNNIFAGRENVKATVYHGSIAVGIDEPGVELTIKKQFKFLMIGNSYTQDASNCGQGMKESQLFNILQAMLGEDAEITLGVIISGGKGINWHATQAELNSKKYSFSIIDFSNNKWKSMGSVSSAEALSWTDWDVVSLQHYGLNTKTGQESISYPNETDAKFYSLEAASEYMLDHIAKHVPYAEVYFYTHWAQTKAIALNANINRYNEMAAYIPVVLDYVGTESGKKFESIIPVGLSIQNARTTYLALLSYNTSAYDDNNLNLVTDAQIGLQRDGGHLSFNIGRYIAALTFAEMIIPQELRAEDYVLPNIRTTESIGELPKEYTTISQLAVNKAVESWGNGDLSVTEIVGYEQDPIVALEESLSNTIIEIPSCSDKESIKECVTETVEAFLPNDFILEAIELAADALGRHTFTFQATIRFGYTSRTVTVNCEVINPYYEASSGWLSVPISTEEVAWNLAYKIEDGILTFHDFGDPSSESYGSLPDYTNANAEDINNYRMIPWYQEKNQVKKVVFDETISYVGSYVLTNMDNISEIHITNKNVILAKDAVLFSTTEREQSLSIYAASTIKTVDKWIRGNGGRKVSSAISDAKMYLTDLEYLAPEFVRLSDALKQSEILSNEELYNALVLLNKIPKNTYNISNYELTIRGIEIVISELCKWNEGYCGETLTYRVVPGEENNRLKLVISGSGDMELYQNEQSIPWSDFMSSISEVYISELATNISLNYFPENAVFYVNVNSEAYKVATENKAKVQLEELRILCIGNSHTVDYSTFFSNVLKDLDNAGLGTDIVVDKATIGSIGLYSGRNSNVNAVYRSQLSALNNSAGAYNKLTKNRYDLIIVQDYMESVVDTPEVFLNGMASFVETMESIISEYDKGAPEIAWFTDWVDIRATGGDNSLRDGEGNKISLESLSREAVYEKSLANVEAIEDAIAKKVPNMPDFVIHAATIKENARSSYLGTSKLNENNVCCLLERDTTHASYEVGRYLMSAGVLDEIVRHYDSVLMGTVSNVGKCLSLENGPVATGSDSQYLGTVNENILSIIREAISSPNSFKQSQYVEDPVFTLVNEIKEAEWNLNEVTDEATVAETLETQVTSLLGNRASVLNVEMNDYIAIYDFTVTITIVCGYSVEAVVYKHHDCQFVSNMTPPTYTEQGYTTFSCYCGASYVDDYVDPLGYFAATQAVLEDGERIVLQNRNVIMCNKHMLFSCQVDELGEGIIRLGHGKKSYASGYIEITDSKLRVCSYYTSTSVKEYNHGLTIDGSLKVSIDVSESNAVITISTDSGTYTKSCTWTSARNGELFCEVEGSTLHNVDCRWYCDDIDTPIWFFGDSYFNVTSSGRWPYYMYKDGHKNNLLFGYPGMGAQVGIEQFKDFLQFGKPEYAVWCLGMNNGDSKAGVINKTWLTATEEFLQICDENGITPILCTIPTTPKVNNRVKNEWVENSGQRYIDFDLAVVENHMTGEWFEGMAASDLNHPTTLGAQALYLQVVADFPELGTGETEICVHKLQAMGARPAECEYAGRLDYMICTLCGGTFADAEASIPVTSKDMRVEPHGHYFGEWTVVEDATCLADGQAQRSCSECGLQETRNIEKLNHDYNITVTTPTCTAQGYTTHTCERCGDSYVDSETAAAGHSYGAWVVKQEVSCNEKGLERRDCKNCDHYEERDIEELGHNYNSVVTEPTCTDQGYTTHTCERCGDSYVDSETAAAGHSYGIWVIKQEASCTEKGLDRRDCKNCDHYGERDIEALGHNYNSVVTEPTCTEQGYTSHICSRCDYRYTDEIVSATGHHYGDWYMVKMPTCIEEGLEHRECEDCERYEERSIAVLGHAYESIITEPTCTKQGYTTHTCSRCGVSYKNTYVSATGHSFEEWEVTKEATCTEEGQERRDCTNCEHFEERSMSVLGHAYESIITEPTCIEQGYTTYTCERCGDSYVDSETPASGHSYGAWVVEQEASCTEKGLERRECKNCDHYEERDLEALGHNYKSVVTEPTCTDQGYTIHTCEYCGDSYRSEFVAETGHSYGEWYQTKEADCMSKGQERRECEVCDHFEVRSIGKLPHSYVATVVVPTCTTKGYTTHSCEYCNSSYADSFVQALGHKWNVKTTVDKRATASKEGSMSTHCSVCDIKKDVKVIPKIVSASCTAKLLYTGTKRVPTITIKNASGIKLVNGTDYTYAVYNANGKKVSSPKAVGKYTIQITYKGKYSGTRTLSYSIIPAAPEKVTLKLTAYNKVKVSWSKVEGATGYYVYYKKSTASTYFYKTVTGTSVTLKELSGNTKYNIKVVPYGGSVKLKGNSSTVKSITTLRNLSKPKNVKLKLTGYNDIKVTWDKVSYAKGYYVYYKKSTASAYSTYKRVTGTSVTLKNLEGNTKYNIKVVPYGISNGTKIKDESVTIKSITTLRNLPKPKTLTLKALSKTSVKATWCKVSYAKGYYVYYKVAGSDTYKLYKTTTGTSITISGLKKNTKYTIKVVPYGVSNSEKVKSDNYITKSKTTLKNNVK